MDTDYYKQYEPFFGSWKIVRLIGEGTYGKVFEIRRSEYGIEEKAALKIISIPASKSGNDSGNFFDVQVEGQQLYCLLRRS